MHIYVKHRPKNRPSSATKQWTLDVEEEEEEVAGRGPMRVMRGCYMLKRQSYFVALLLYRRTVLHVG